MAFSGFPSLPSLPSPPSPGDIIDAVEDGAGYVVDKGKDVVDITGDGLEFIGEAAISAYNATTGALRDVRDCVASNFGEFSGTLVAVVDGAVLECDQVPKTFGRLTATSSTTPMLANKRAATVTDHVVGRNVSPFHGLCKKTGQPCDITPVGDWIPGARGAHSGALLLPSNAQLVCSHGGFISVTTPGQTSVQVKMDGVPLAPPGVSLEANRQLALSMRTKNMPAKLKWFYDHVHNKGPWDYKQRGSQYEDFGNYHYGVIGAALGIPTPVLRRAAGLAQRRSDPTDHGFGSPKDVCGDSSFGDDPRDQEMISAGIRHR